MIFKTSLKFFSSLGLAVLIYFAGFQQGCSHVFFDSLEPLSCDELDELSDRPDCKKIKVFEPNKSPVIPDPPGPTDPPIIPDPPGPTDPPSKKPPEYFWKYNYFISLGKVAFVFVLDISSSTAVEHRNIDKQLSPFLHSIKNLKYHVALITMDISNSPGNPVRNAYYQDGKFIPIGGRLYLSNTNLGSSPDPSVIANFRKALVREETRKCDKRNQPRQSRSVSCPSSDERGTYAMNLAVQNPDYRQFFNRDHVIFIPITDEDVRSGKDFYNQPDMEEYQPEELDLPETLVNTISKIFPRSRTFSFHPIIIPPGDNSCLSKQSTDRDGGHGSGRGYYGDLYAELTRPRNFNHNGNFIRGNIISICDKNYESQLARISLFAQKSKIPLPCDNPESVQLFANGRQVDSDYEIEGRTLYVSSERALTLSSRVEVEVYCKEKNLR